MSQVVSEDALDYEEILRRGGRNFGDEDFALFKCPGCERVYMMEYEVDTVYLDALDLSKRIGVDGSFECLGCGVLIPQDRPWVGPNAAAEFQVSWAQLARSNWTWAVRLLLKPEDVEIAIARVGGGQDALIVMHKPTGIRRSKGPPQAWKFKHEMLREIQAELLERGLTQYIRLTDTDNS